MAGNGKRNGKKGGKGGDGRPSGGSLNGHANGHANGKTKHAPSLDEPEALERKSEPSPGEPAEEAESELRVEAAEAPAAEPIPEPHAAPPPPKGAAWAEPVAKFEAIWTRFESRLLVFVLLAQILALVAWVFLNGLSESVTTTAGVTFRAVILGAGLGTAAWFATKQQTPEKRRAITMTAMFLGLAVAPLWKRLAIGNPGGSAFGFDKSMFGYFDNMKGWLQEGSTLTLLGGLRGLGTRLTLWLALLGGSLATAAGKHIHIDVVFRFLPKKLRTPVAILNYMAAAAVCLGGVWGFFDHIAIESYGSKADDRPALKMENAAHHIGEHLYFVRKQIGLDLRSLPHILKGERYDQWMTAQAWNEWVDGSGLDERFGKDKTVNIRIPEGTHPPFVVSPDGEALRGSLAHTLGLVFPFGLLAIAIRFILRAILTLSGHLSADPDEAHKEDLRGAEDPAAGKESV